MAGYSHITRCSELTEGDIVNALEDRRLSKVLLDRLAKVARPGEGAPKVLHFLARIAGEGGWIDGTMRVEVVSEGDGVSVEVLTEMGAGMQERLFPSLKMGAPFKEFSRMVEHMPRTIEPLVVKTKGPGRLVLEAENEEPLPSMMPEVSIADDSLYGGKRSTRPKATGPSRADLAALKRSRSSGKLRAVLLDGAFQEEEAPTKIPARSGATLRPAVMGAPAPTRKKTLRPDSHAVPPPIPAVPQAPRLPRVDAGESDSPRVERFRGRKPPMTVGKAAAPPPTAEAPKRRSVPAAERTSDSPPRTKRTSKAEVKIGESEPAPASLSSSKMRAAKRDSAADDLDWEIPALDTALPPPSSGGRRGTLQPNYDIRPPSIPAMPTPRLPRLEGEAGSASGKSERPKAKRAKSSAKSRAPGALKGKGDPRAEEDEDD